MTRSAGWTTLGLPLFLFYVIAFIVPQAIFLSSSLYLSAGRATLGAGPTLANFLAVLSDPYYLVGFRQSLLVAAGVAVIGLLLALPIAFFIVHGRSRWSFVVLLIIAGMLFSNAVIRTLGWRILLSSVGPINATLLSLHLATEPLPLIDNYTGVLIGLIHALLPIYVIVLLPVVQTVPRNLILASEGLGASRWQTFRHVVFPLIRGGVIAALVLSFANSIGAFTTPALLGGGRVVLLPILIRERVLLVLNWAVGATLATLMLVLVIGIVSLVAWRGWSRPAAGTG